MSDFNDEKRELQQRPTLEETLQALKDGEHDTISAKVFYGLSDLSEANMERVKPVWNALDPEYRLKVVRRLEDIAETNFELDYHTIGMFALSDEEADVRKTAINVLAEDTSLELMQRLMDMAQWDESTPVRAVATSALGRFVLMGELGDIPEKLTIPVQDLLVGFLSSDSEELEVRRRALESIANCSHEAVEDAIHDAYYSSERLMRVSAIFAMGRTCDEQWEELVLKELNNSDPEMRYEAARASGELELIEATPILTQLARDDEREIREMAIWSLGEIGSKEAIRVLTALAKEAQADDDEILLELIEDALSSASLVGGGVPHFFDFSDN